MIIPIKKQSNRAIQRKHATYKKKSEISEALYLIKHYINESTYKFLSHFLYTNGTGVTQAKNKVICEKVGIAERTYYKTVKPELETVFEKPILITVKAPMKYDKKRNKKVKSSPFKALVPLSTIKHLIQKKEQEESDQFANEIREKVNAIIEPITEPFEGQNAVNSAVNGAVNGAVKNVSENPWESKGEVAFSVQQNNSCRENHVEKNINNKYKSIIENDSVLHKSDHSISNKKYFLKKEVQALLTKAQKELQNDGLKGLTTKQKEVCGNKIQLFAHNYGLKITDIQEIAIDIYHDCACYNAHDLGGYFYKSLENRFLDNLLEQNGVDITAYVENGDYEELDEMREQIKVAYSEGLIMPMNELAATFDSTPSAPKKKKRTQAKRKVIRTELVPNWLYKQKEEEHQKEQEKRQREKREEQERMKDPNYFAKMKKEFEELLSRYNDNTSPQNGSYAF